LGHVACVGQTYMFTGLLQGNLKEDLGISGIIILKWGFEKQGGRVWTAFLRLSTWRQWRAFVSTITDLRGSLKSGEIPR
jgi:hypothetical protein